jgi:hypothetical protein
MTADSKTEPKGPNKVRDLPAPVAPETVAPEVECETCAAAKKGGA